MSVRLQWGSANATLAESIKVYRSDTSFTADALPAVLTTLAGSATSYDDTAVVRNKIYYYRVGMVRAGEELISELLIMGHYPDTGIGPQKILRGTWELGYFGFVNAADFFTASALIALTGNPGGAVASDAQLTGWHKFIRKGKILMIPNYRPSGSTVTWLQIYNLGLVYGVDGPGDAPGLATFYGYAGPVNQNKIVSAGAYQYKVRLPTASDQPTSELVTDPAKIAASEWIQLMGRMGNTSLPTSPQDKWCDQVSGNPSITATASFATNVNNLTTDGAAFDSFQQVAQNAAAASSRYTAWMPVLELIF